MVASLEVAEGRGGECGVARTRLACRNPTHPKSPSTYPATLIITLTRSIMLRLTQRKIVLHRAGLQCPARSYSSPPSAPQLILANDHHPNITTLTLNRPQAKNAISVQLLRELRDAVERIKWDGSVSPLHKLPHMAVHC